MKHQRARRGLPKQRASRKSCLRLNFRSPCRRQLHARRESFADMMFSINLHVTIDYNASFGIQRAVHRQPLVFRLLLLEAGLREFRERDNIRKFAFPAKIKIKRSICMA
jgi:hypothetical protein